MKGKKLTVGIIGIPIQLERKHNKLKEFFAHGLTDYLRSKTKEFIKRKSKEGKVQIDAQDLGELFDTNDNLSSDGELTGISKSCLDKLAEDLKKKMKGIDFLIVLGGIHTGAYLLYHLPGEVERFDLHEDDDDINIPFHTSYMKYVTILKNPSQISNHDWTDILGTNLEDEAGGKLFDIDIDYYVSTEYCKFKKADKEQNFNRIISAIQKTKPKVIGLFECQTMDKIEYKKMLEILWNGIKVRDVFEDVI